MSRLSSPGRGLNVQQCGFCAYMSRLLRRAMCIESRRSSESYYRELGDQETLKIDDKASVLSDDTEEIKNAACSSAHGEFAELLTRHPCTGRFLTMHKRRKKRLLTKSLVRDVALLDDLLMGQVDCMLGQSAQWKFNAFTLDNVSGGRCLPVLSVHLFHVYGLLTHFRLDAAKAWRLFSMIEEGYHSTNPYHTSVHAADVTQAMHCFLQQEQIRAHMEPLEVMACIIAAVAHDVDHPGVNQPFLIATSNHLAALYRNTSVLENHHWRSAVSCVIESGLFDGMTELRRQLERQVSSLILATDITRQQDYLSRFKGLLDTDALDLKKPEHRHLCLQIALKCADISNPCRPWQISRKWSLKVCEEFFRQGDYERKLNLPVTALCDRHTTSIPKIQTGFFKFVVTPLITEWHRFLQNDLSAQMLQNLLYNQGKWDTLVAEEIAEETTTEISDADLVDDDLETCSGTNISDSAELLLPPLRRSSLNPVKQNGLKEQLRRFSVPLNVFQDSKQKKTSESRETSLCGSEHSLHSQLSVLGTCGTPAAARILSSEKLLPDSSIASITTPMEATRLSSVLKDGATWKLVRQQTFPPLETARTAAALTARHLYTSNEDDLFPTRKTEIGQRFLKFKESRFSSMFKRDKDDEADPAEKENLGPLMEGDPLGLVGSRRESAPVGSQLRDNLVAPLLPDLLLQRRKSMPTDTQRAANNSDKRCEKKLREMTTALPQLLRRTLSNKDGWPRRRGSAPAPVAPSDLPRLVARHSVNGGRRKPSAIATCQQWLAKTSYSVQERTFSMPRRSSLPVEVLTGTPTY